MGSKVTYTEDLPKYEGSILPVAIQHAGEANTSEFFTPSKSTETREDKEVKTCYFRGLKMVGKDLELPNKRVFVMEKSEFLTQNPEKEDQVDVANQYAAIAEVDKLCLYGHDTEAPLYSKWGLMNEWNKVANIIHGRAGQ